MSKVDVLVLYQALHILHVLAYQVNECEDDGWFKQPHLAESVWTLGLGEAAHLLRIKKSVCTG